MFTDKFDKGYYRCENASEIVLFKNVLPWLTDLLTDRVSNWLSEWLTDKSADWYLFVWPRGVGGGGTPYNGLNGEAPPERGTFFRL